MTNSLGRDSVFLLPILIRTGAAAEPAPNVGIGSRVYPRGIAAVMTSACNSHLCGGIGLANTDAHTDARDSGIPNVIVTGLTRDCATAGAEFWFGVVFVPDMGGSLSATFELKGPAAPKNTDSVLVRLICKSRIWRRV